MAVKRGDVGTSTAVVLPALFCLFAAFLNTIIEAPCTPGEPMRAAPDMLFSLGTVRAAPGDVLLSKGDCLLRLGLSSCPRFANSASGHVSEDSRKKDQVVELHVLRYLNG